MAVTRNIRSIYVTDYNKSIGEVVGHLESGSGSAPTSQSTTYERSTITGVHEITKGNYFWGQGDYVIREIYAGRLDENLNASDTTITLLDATNFTIGGGSIGYALIENEIIKYTGVTSTDLTGCVRGQLNTEAVIHDGTASTIEVERYQRGVVQSIDYEDEDEVYGVRVALPFDMSSVSAITDYYIYRFEFAKHSIDMVNYEDEENPTTIYGSIPGY